MVKWGCFHAQWSAYNHRLLPEGQTALPLSLKFCCSDGLERELLGSTADRRKVNEEQLIRVDDLSIITPFLGFQVWSNHYGVTLQQA
jgi:hypothetical protein